MNELVFSSSSSLVAERTACSLRLTAVAKTNLLDGSEQTDILFFLNTHLLNGIVRHVTALNCYP